MDRGLHFFVVAAAIVVDVALYVIVARSATGKAARGVALGIRTKATQASEKAWLAAHVTAYPIVRDTALVNAALMIVSLFVPIEFQLYVVQLALGALVIGIIFAYVQANKTAKATHG